MNYVYDLTINWNPYYIDFFEWDIEDKIYNIHKIPIVKIDEETLRIFIYSNISVDKVFLNNIKVHSNYICIFMSENDSVAIMFNEKGKSVMKSSLIANEELDILENYYNIDYMNINYIIDSSISVKLITRQDQRIIKYLNDNINKLDAIKDNNKIKYIYYECYGSLEKNSFKALNRIKDELIYNNRKNELYNFFKLIEQK